MEDLSQHPMLVDMLSSFHMSYCIEIDLSYISDESFVGVPEGRHSRLVLSIFAFTPADHSHEKYSRYEPSIIQPIENMGGGFPVNSISIGFPSTDKSLLPSGHRKPQLFK